MDIDPSIFDHAESTARAYYAATDADVRLLAEAWQHAYEDWASEMDARGYITPDGLQKKRGVEYGCGNPKCTDCYEPKR